MRAKGIYLYGALYKDGEWGLHFFALRSHVEAYYSLAIGKGRATIRRVYVKGVKVKP